MHPSPTRRHQGLAVAWAMVIGVFMLGFCCGGVTVIAVLSSALSD